MRVSKPMPMSRRDTSRFIRLPSGGVGNRQKREERSACRGRYAPFRSFPTSLVSLRLPSSMVGIGGKRARCPVGGVTPCPVVPAATALDGRQPGTTDRMPVTAASRGRRPRIRPARPTGAPHRVMRRASVFFLRDCWYAGHVRCFRGTPAVILTRPGV